MVEGRKVLEVALEWAERMGWKSQCVQCAYVLARVYHEEGELGKRDEMAQQFLVYQHQG